MKREKDFYIRVDAIVPKGIEEILREELYTGVLNQGLWIEDFGDDVVIKAYPEDGKTYIEKIKGLGVEIKDIRIVKEEKKDYKALTMRYFRPIEINGIHIIAPWSRRKKGKDTIVIEPGMAFGTGRHESTKIMITLMGALDMKGRDVLDVGCGSGILSIYASILGARRVTALDIDIEAVEATRKNISLNALDNIDVIQGSLNGINHRYSTILANLDIRTFSLYGQDIVKKCEEKGTIVISGILNGEREQVLSYMKPFIPVAEKKKGGWLGFVLQRGVVSTTEEKP
ncbi:MAG: 50S ribosomal protein L11 methyltransferase [Syntrophorhabdaceae bacterium]|nr:50S ribosomal protein L11 methyltransferase [Syntrophorhabdaceae bacterium]